MIIRIWRWNRVRSRWQSGVYDAAVATREGLGETKLLYVPNDPTWYGTHYEAQGIGTVGGGRPLYRTARGKAS